MRRERALSWAVALLVVAAPLAIGGAHAWSQVWLSAAGLLVVAAYVTLLKDRGLRWVPFALPAAIAVAWTAAQLLPLPAGLVQVLSPGAVELRTAAQGTAPAFLPLTVDTPATVLQVAKGFCYLGLLLVVASLCRPAPRARRVLLVVAGMSGGMAVLSMAQRVLGAETMLGLVAPQDSPGADFFGTFVNGNHAASFFALGGLTSLGLAIEMHDRRRVLMTACAGLSLAGVLSTQSRAGAAGFALGLCVLGAIVLAKRFGAARGLAVTVLAVAIAGVPLLWAADGLRSRLTGAPEELWSNQKVRGFRDGLTLTRHFALTGVGRGAFEAPINAHRAQAEGVRLVFPENLVIQAASEWGVPLAFVIFILCGAAARRVAPGLKGIEIGTLGAACGVIAVVAHEMADFGLEMAGVAIPTVVALGAVVARVQELSAARRPAARRVPPRLAMAALGVWGLVLAGAAWAAPRTLDADWERWRTASRNRAPGTKEGIAAAMSRHPASDLFPLLAAGEALQKRDPAVAIRHLNRAMLLNPANPQAHLLAARVLLDTGHAAQAALEYRAASLLEGAVRVDQLMPVLGKHVVDAVVQKPALLFKLAHVAAERGHLEVAEEAAARAVTLDGESASALAENVQIAVEAKSPRLMVAGARRLLAADPSVEGVIAASLALATAGERDAAFEAVRLGMNAHPRESALVLFAARQRFDHGDLTGARSLVTQALVGVPSLATRRAAEELQAGIAEKAGDPEGALRARARAKLIARKMRELGEATP